MKSLLKYPKFFLYFFKRGSRPIFRIISPVVIYMKGMMMKSDQAVIHYVHAIEEEITIKAAQENQLREKTEAEILSIKDQLEAIVNINHMSVDVNNYHTSKASQIDQGFFHMVEHMYKKLIKTQSINNIFAIKMDLDFTDNEFKNKLTFELKEGNISWARVFSKMFLDEFTKEFAEQVQIQKVICINNVTTKNDRLIFTFGYKPLTATAALQKIALNEWENKWEQDLELPPLPDAKDLTV